MRTRTRLATAALAALVIAPAAWAAPAPTQVAAAGVRAEVFVPAPGQVLPPASYRPGGPLTAPALETAVRRHQVAALARAGVDRRVLDAAQAGGGPAARVVQGAIPPFDDSVETTTDVFIVFGAGGLVPVGDLDGDRKVDLLDARYARQKDGGTSLRLVVRRAADGRVLWQRAYEAGRNHIPFAAPATLGSPSRAGLVLYDIGFEQRSEEDATVTTSLSLTGLTGRTGATAWRYEVSGTASGDEDGITETAVPSLAGQLEGGAATQFLVNVTDASTSAAPVTGTLTSRGRVRPVLVDGATGQARDLGSPVERDDARPTSQAVPDLSGDGQDDVVLLAAGAEPQVTLRRSADGADVWTNDQLPLQRAAFAVPVGRPTGGPVPDLAVATGAPAREQSALPLGPSGGDERPRHGRVALLRGTDGVTQLSVEGDQPVQLDRAGTPALPAVGVVTSDVTREGRRTTSTLTLAAYRPQGEQVYRRGHSLSAESGDGQDEDASGGFAFAFPVGDLAPDGAQDLQAWLFVQAGESHRSTRRLLDGATGRDLLRSGEPLFGSLSSHGADLVTVSAGKGVLVTGRSGRTGKPVFSVRLSPGLPLTYGFAHAGDVRPGPCDEVLVGAEGERDDFAAVLSNHGRLRWSVRGRSGTNDVRPVTLAPRTADRCS